MFVYNAFRQGVTCMNMFDEQLKDIEDKLSVREIESKNIFSKSNLPIGDYSVNPYVGCIHACKYCYACFMGRFSGHTEEWGAYLDVKTWPKTLNPTKYNHNELVVGTVTDPYNSLEQKFARTKRLLTELQGTTAKITIITKSDLILHDLDLIKSFPNIRVAWSINTLDESFKQDMDLAVSIERRLAAMKAFYDNGVQTICFISPIFPKITNVQAIIDAVKKQCNTIWLENLNLRGAYKARILKYIEAKYPEFVPIYDEIYRKNKNQYWIDLAEELRAFCETQGLVYVVDNDNNLERCFSAPPVVVNFFYHSQIKKSAKARKL